MCEEINDDTEPDSGFDLFNASNELFAVELYLNSEEEPSTYEWCILVTDGKPCIFPERDMAMRVIDVLRKLAETSAPPEPIRAHIAHYAIVQHEEIVIDGSPRHD